MVPMPRTDAASGGASSKRKGIWMPVEEQTEETDDEDDPMARIRAIMKKRREKEERVE